jgi:hypothetical protein
MGEIASNTIRQRDVFDVIKNSEYLEGYVEISFIMTTPKETKEQRIEKLKKIAERL